MSLRDDIRAHGAGLPAEEKEAYRNGVWFWIYHRHLDDFDTYLSACHSDPNKNPAPPKDLFPSFREGVAQFLSIVEGPGNKQDRLAMNETDVAELFAFQFQLRRGLAGIVDRIVGVSQAAVDLRIAVWEAIFTRRLLWSFQYLKDRMANFSTLILGPSGSGKDLVAEAIGTSQYIPYDPKTNRFAVNYVAAYHPVNLSALTPTLIESELFGHEKGAFTGAVSARKGHLEECSPYGVLFLDEIGDLSGEIQVKLLRVLQSREFYPLGGGKARRFHGRIVSATNRDIPESVAAGRMREDFLYRIGSTVVRVPSLSLRFSQRPEEVPELLRDVLARVLGHVEDALFGEMETKIRQLLSEGYDWPGNVREFEQCVRTLLIASDYQPLVGAKGKRGELESLFDRMEEHRATIQEVLGEYCRNVHKTHGTYQEAAKRLDVDWRTVKKYAEGGIKSI
jgi:transcriptional regulator of acetoin/glycerol metabolism